MKYLLLVLCSIISCKPHTKTSQNTDFTDHITYTADWSSLQQHKTPNWFLDSKFGIYCHWGPYAVPAHKNEWYSHWMYVNANNPEAKNGKAHPVHDYHVKTYGTLDTFGYKDFIPMFTAKKFDPVVWADLFEKSGAKFAGPVSEHADGFAMWDSDLTSWDAKDMGPKRDIMGELAHEIRKRDMKFIATFHRHWLLAWFPTWDKTTDASNPDYAGLYGPKMQKGDFKYPKRKPNTESYYPLANEAFNKDWLARLKEIVDKYNPDLVWFDNKMDVIGEQYRKAFLEYYYNHGVKHQQEVVATYKFNDFAKGTAVLDLERSRMSEKQDFPWLTDDSIDWNTWSHTTTPKYKSTNRLIDFLIDVVSKNGAVLLNITPRADGSIPEPVEERLLQMGDWLKVNGEAIYGTRPFTIYGEGDAKIVEGHLSEEKNADHSASDIRFTTKGNILYAIVLDWPKDNITTIRSLKKDNTLLKESIKSIEFLANGATVPFAIDDNGLHITFPKTKMGDYAFVFRLNLE